MSRKTAELREQTDEQLLLLLKELQQNMFRFRLQTATEKLESPSVIETTRRQIARIKTILRERELAAEAEAPAAEAEVEA